MDLKKTEDGSIEIYQISTLYGTTEFAKFSTKIKLPKGNANNSPIDKAMQFDWALITYTCSECRMPDSM